MSGLAVIVFGVLIALWADAAWAERSDRLRERAIVADLLEEFRENQTQLKADIDASQASLDAASRWQDAMLGVTALTPDSVSRLWLAAQEWTRYDPVTGAVRSVLDGGELATIRSDELRRALAGWSDRAEETRNTANDASLILSNLGPMILSLDPGESLASGERSAVILYARLSGGSLSQLITLLQDIDEIVALLEAQHDR